jgi:hypothetical protein
MWGFIKKLLGRGSKPVPKTELREVSKGGILYVYPKTEFVPRSRKVEEPQRHAVQDRRQAAQAWMKSVREVDALYARLAG